MMYTILKDVLSSASSFSCLTCATNAAQSGYSADGYARYMLSCYGKFQSSCVAASPRRSSRKYWTVELGKSGRVKCQSIEAAWCPALEKIGAVEFDCKLKSKKDSSLRG